MSLIPLPTTDILRFIPQRLPFVLIDVLLEAAAEKTVTQYRIAAGGPLVEDDMLSESGLVENMAQTAAAGAGYRAAIGGGTGVAVGYIGALKALKVVSLPEIGEVVETSASVIHVIGPASVVEAVVRRLDGSIAAVCELKIFSAAT